MTVVVATCVAVLVSPCITHAMPPLLTSRTSARLLGLVFPTLNRCVAAIRLLLVRLSPAGLRRTLRLRTRALGISVLGSVRQLRQRVDSTLTIPLGREHGNAKRLVLGTLADAGVVER